ncbi:hypothetical protein INS49_007807 [Diaporthe citri]|uniref:uncharacterized protein n=1 Tax=Diaporthe citri TaxID=83186 RepID=UPI001C7E9600|nr:uncharacterized protein INS49_007807 [Diaporthe citri]KAG6362714.1 hypothetical protein INS49_007807 [Diaporthe citri]
MPLGYCFGMESSDVGSVAGGAALMDKFHDVLEQGAATVAGQSLENLSWAEINLCRTEVDPTHWSAHPPGSPGTVDGSGLVTA